MAIDHFKGMGKSKETEKKLAEHYYVDKGWSVDQIVEKVHVHRCTVDRWIEDNSWRSKRAARHASKERQLARLNELLERQVEKMLELEDNSEASDKEIGGLADRISKTNKAIETAMKEMEPPLSVQLSIIGKYNDALMKYDAKVYMSTVDFQEHYIYELADRIG
jgi:transposase